MTLIIALNCKDGIIMASDGQTTVGSSGGPVRIEAEKIFKVNDTTLFGASGSVGNIQRSLEIIRTIKDLEGDWNSAVMHNVKQQLFPTYHTDLQRHATFYRTINPNQIPPPPIADVILAKLQENGEKIIWHIAPDCSDELLHDFGYACTGNGDIFAHTLLKGYEIKNIDVERGKLLAYNTIKLGIEVGAYGLGEPIHIGFIRKTTESKVEIKKLSDEEMMALKDTWLSWREAQREMFDKIQLKLPEK